MLQGKVRRHHLHVEQDSYGGEAGVWMAYTEPSPAIPNRMMSVIHHTASVSVFEISTCGQIQPQQLCQYEKKWWRGGRIQNVRPGGVNSKKEGERLTGGAEPKICKCMRKEIKAENTGPLLPKCAGWMKKQCCSLTANRSSKAAGYPNCSSYHQHLSSSCIL